MQFTKRPPFPLTVCLKCQASGYIGYRRCAQCRGMSIGYQNRSSSALGKTDEPVLYFGEPLTHYHITLRTARRFLQTFRIIGALVFGLGFIGLFGWWVTSRDLWLALFSADFWLDTAAPMKITFWLGVICLSYMWYRLILQGEPKAEISYDKKDWQNAGLEAADLGGGAASGTGPGSAVGSVGQTGILDWNKVARLKSNQKVNIASVFTDGARLALENAWRLAAEFKHPLITPEHFFCAFLSAPNVSGIFIRLGISPSQVQTKVKRLFALGPGDKSTDPGLSAEAGDLLFQAYALAREFRDRHVRETELLVAAVQASEPVQEILYELEIDSEKLTNVVEWVRIRERLRDQARSFRRAAARRSKHGIDRAMTAVATPYLNSFSQDVTLMAKFGYLAPCVARDKEIQEIFRVIEGGRQSVILVGERGVGKRSLVEGVAQRMVEESVPDRLRDKRLIELSTSALVAGTSLAGAQERLLRIMREISRAGNIILYINNLHDLMGGDSASDEGLNLSETLAEQLGPGRFLTIATTIPEGYNRHIVNSEIGKVFAKVVVGQMNENQTIQVLESKVGSLEYKHQVFFSYAALEVNVKLAARFLHDQNLPASAMAVMAEVATHVKSKKGPNQLVTEEDVSEVIADKTGIPVTSLTEDESTKLLRLEEEMHKRVVGQDEAVALVANALRRARAEIRSTNRPMANFLFLGPTGVGKTELAKTIAAVYFGGENRMIRLDMSEFQDKSSIYRLIGQPGQQGTGLLTEAVRQQPFAVVLLDELEKADPDVLNLFLQVFDDGRLTDSVGRVIDFTSTIIIATSNAGTAYVQDSLRSGKPLADIRESMLRGQLREYYRPEFLNRFDGVVLFKPLERGEIKTIASFMLKRVAKDLELRGVELRVLPSALDKLAEVGFDPDFGARPMRRAIQELIENKLAELILEGQLKRRDVVVLGEGGKLTVEKSTRKS